MAINILFTSGGRRVELIRAFQRAYQLLDISGNIVVTDINTLAPALHIADKPYIVPRFRATNYIPTLVEICKRENIDLIFPLIDPDIPMLAKNRKCFEDVNAIPVVIDIEMVKICEDKWLTYQFFRDKNIITPQSWLPEHLDFDMVNYPVFIKPRVGSGSKNAFKVNNQDELRFFLNYIENPIIQEFIDGVEVTNDIFCDLERVVLEVVLRQRIETRGGEVSKGVTIKNAVITDNCIKIANKLSAVGTITSQCIVRDGIPYFTEVNARFGGGAPLSIVAGANMPLWLLAKSAGVEIDIPQIGSYQIGLHLARFDDSLFLTEKQLGEMESHHI